MKVKRAISVTRLDDLTVEELRRLLEEVPDKAKFSVSHHKGDYNRMDYYSASLTWEDEL